MPWYVVATKARQESRAAEHLLNQSFEVFLPMIDVEKTKRGKLLVEQEALFSGYLFLKALPEHEGLAKVRSTRGVRDLIRVNGYPSQAPDEVVQSLIDAQLGGDLACISKVPRKGDTVRFKSGPFKSLEAIFDMIDGTERAMVLLSILGKQQRLRVELTELELQ